MSDRIRPQIFHTIMIGTKLAHYEITSHLGTGGMGEVYRATDSKLGRNVAIKLLPAAFASDADRLSRFRREAQVLASLNHPNIAQIYGLEDSGGQSCIVMELVEGPTLEQRLKSAPLSIEETLHVAIQIAEALEAAHERGIIHRDLKPANVILREDGRVKVLDFGLAKAVLEQSPSKLSNEPTLVSNATRQGVIVGTIAYMSPEQARGLQADHRSDVFSFGCVVFEMICGFQAFHGDTPSDLLASVLKSDPSLDTPVFKRFPVLRKLLQRCLDKNARNRWQAMGDVRIELESIDLAAISETNMGTVSRKSAWPMYIAAAIVVAAGLLSWVIWNARTIAPAHVVRLSYSLPDDQTITVAGRAQVLAVSPDGAQIVYAANRRLYIRALREFEARPIAGTEAGPGTLATHPVFSPDGKSIAFWSGSGSDRTLQTVPATGGTPLDLCPLRAGLMGMSWDKDGILFSEGRGISRVPATGGSPVTIISVNNDEFAHGPQMLPDGETILFTLAKGATANAIDWDKAQIVAQSLKSGKREIIVDAGSDGRYLPTGHLVYALGTKLMVVPFDAGSLKTTGTAIPILEGVSRAGGSGTAQFSLSVNGTLAYVPGSAVPTRQRSIAFMDMEGKFENTRIPPGPYFYPRISPDGKQVAYVNETDEEANVWIFELSGATSPRKLTFGGKNRHPLWSSNGQRVAYQSDREGDLGIWWQRADGSGTAERLTKPDKGISHFPDSWFPDGSGFSFTSVKDADGDIWTFSLRDKKATPYLQAANSFEGRAVLSPDGKWIAYQARKGPSGEGLDALFVRRFPDDGTQYQISDCLRGIDPVWSPDGTALYCFPGQGLFSRITVHTRPTFTYGNPLSINKVGFLGDNGPQNPRGYDLMPDGRRFIAPINADRFEAADSMREVRIILNWLDELKQRIPIK